MLGNPDPLRVESCKMCGEQRHHEDLCFNSRRREYYCDQCSGFCAICYNAYPLDEMRGTHCKDCAGDAFLSGNGETNDVIMPPQRHRRGRGNDEYGGLVFAILVILLTVAAVVG